jgi:hypothetical protein
MDLTGSNKIGAEVTIVSESKTRGVRVGQRSWKKETCFFKYAYMKIFKKALS